MLKNFKSWAWWKVHEKIIMDLVSQGVQSLIDKIEGLDSVSFKFRNKEYHFTKQLSNKESK